MITKATALLLVVWGIPRAQDLPEAGLDDLKLRLLKTSAALDDPEFLEGSMQEVTAFAAHWDAFEWRFGISLEKIEGSNVLQELAERIRPKAESKSREGAYFNVVPARIVLAVCLELTGNDAAAEKLLDEAPPGGHSGNWYATVELAKSARRSAMRCRAKKLEEALTECETAIKNVKLALHSKNEDLLFARYGWLLSRLDRAEDAQREWQRVVDLFPGQTGAKLAKRDLAASEKFIRPTATTLVAYLSGEDRMRAILALAAHRFPESLERLRELMSSASRWERRFVIEALGELGDPQAIPDLTKVCSEGEGVDRVTALLSLMSLGDERQVVPVLEWLISSKPFILLSGLDERLRASHGGKGPEISKKDLRVGGNKVAAAWLAWLKIH